MNGANSHVLSSLVWFREHPSPRPLLVLLKAVILDFLFVCRGTHLYTLIFIQISSSGLYKIKQNEKPGWKHKRREEK